MTASNYPPGALSDPNAPWNPGLAPDRDDFEYVSERTPEERSRLAAFRENLQQRIANRKGEDAA